MEDLILKIVRNVENIASQYFHDSEDDRKIVINAYNRFCKDERGGNGYVFSCAKKEDLHQCIDCGVTLTELAEYSRKINDGKAIGYFILTDKGLTPFISLFQFECFVFGTMFNVTRCAIAYPTNCKEYQAFYERFVTNLYERAKA